MITTIKHQQDRLRTSPKTRTTFDSTHQLKLLIRYQALILEIALLCRYVYVCACVCMSCCLHACIYIYIHTNTIPFNSIYYLTYIHTYTHTHVQYVEDAPGGYSDSEPNNSRVNSAADRSRPNSRRFKIDADGYKSFKGDWIEGVSENNEKYYYNKSTGESSWHLPDLNGSDADSQEFPNIEEVPMP